MRYVDGFVAAVPTDKKQDYIDHALTSWAVFKRHGALSMVETWGDDIPSGELTSFPMAVKAKDDETVVFSWITWPSKEARNEGWSKVMSDPEMAGMEMPFDGKRMIYGGFVPVLDQGSA
jgi:uncharacterized protein YbaA (DUF1428 family)